MTQPSQKRIFEAIVFNDLEKIYYNRVFDTANREGVVQGREIATLFRKSDLSNPVLEKVWDLCDRTSKGHLTKVEFYVALRSIGMLQSGIVVTLDSLLACKGLDFNQVARFGGEYPIPTSEDVTEYRKKNESIFENEILMIVEKKNPQFCVSVPTPFRQEGDIQDFMVYPIEVYCTTGVLKETKSVINRRFSDFLWLRNCLLRDCPAHMIPPLPQKKLFKRFEDEFVEARRKSLEVFLNNVLSDTELVLNQNLITFLQGSDQELAATKAATPGLVQQLLDTLRFSLKNIKILLKAGEFDLNWGLTLFSQLESFEERLDLLRCTLKECLSIHTSLMEHDQNRIQTLTQLMSTLIPPVAPLSERELSIFQSEHTVKLEERIREENKLFRDSINHIIAQIGCLFEILQQQQTFQANIERIQKQLKSTRDAITENQNSLNSHETENHKIDEEKLTKENEEAEQQYKNVSASLEREIMKFEKTKTTQLLISLQSVARVEAEFCKFQTNHFQHLLQRILEASSSKFPVPIDVPTSVIKNVDLIWISDEEEKNKIHHFVGFYPGQEASKTVEARESNLVKNLQAALVHTSLGFVKTKTNSFSKNYSELESVGNFKQIKQSSDDLEEDRAKNNRKKVSNTTTSSSPAPVVSASWDGML